MFELGARGAEVLALQARLAAAGAPIVVDGVWGPKSEAAWLASLTPPSAPPRVGLWVDKVPVRGQEAKWAAPLGALALSDYSLCAFGSGSSLCRPPAAGLHVERLRALRGALPSEHKARLGVCLWVDSRLEIAVRPQADFIASLAPLLDFLDLDAEEDTRGLTAASARTYVSLLRRALPPRAPIGVNLVPHYTADPLSSPRPHELALVDAVMAEQGECELFFQTYTAFLPDRKWTHDALFRPLGGFQAWASKVAGVWRRRFGKGLRVGLGFALYGQGHPAPHPKGTPALSASLGEMLRLAPAWSPDHAPALRGWSSKHLNPASSKWLADFAKGGI